MGLLHFPLLSDAFVARLGDWAPMPLQPAPRLGRVSLAAQIYREKSGRSQHDCSPPACPFFAVCQTAVQFVGKLP